MTEPAGRRAEEPTREDLFPRLSAIKPLRAANTGGSREVVNSLRGALDVIWQVM